MNFNNIPTEIQRLAAWLTWKLTPGKPKPRKVPYYTNGKPRQGEQGSAEDVAQLATFAAALAAMKSHDKTGIGLAMLAVHGIVALDFDNGVSDGQVTVPFVKSLAAVTYCEFSPSGRGVRAFMRGRLPDRKDTTPPPGSFAVEFFCSSGYVTVTGNVLPACELFGTESMICELTDDVRALFVERFGDPVVASGGPTDADTTWMLSQRPRLGWTIEQASDILSCCDAGCGREDWVKVGMALHHEFSGSKAALELYNTWSAKGGKLYAGRRDVEGRWRSFGKPGKPNTITGNWLLAHADPVKLGAVMASAGADAFEVLPPLTDAELAEAAAMRKANAAIKKAQTRKALDLRMPPLTLAEMQSARLSPRVLVHGLLYADLRNRIAAGGVGKTTLALFEATLGALGRPIWGRVPERAFRTVLVTREDQREILVARLREIMAALDLSDIEKSQVLAQVNILDLTGVSFRVSAIKGDVVVPDAENLEALIGIVEGFTPDWLIFDPLVSFGVGENRVNDSEQGIVEAFRVLRNRLDCCVEGIHHTGKANSREGALDQYAGRNGTALPDGCRMVAVLQPLDDAEWRKATSTTLIEGETGLVMALPKLSYARQQLPIYIKRKGYLFTHVEAQTVTPEDAAALREKRVLQFLEVELSDGRKYNARDLESCTTRLKYSRAEIRDAVTQLKVSGQVALVGGSGIKGSYFEPVGYVACASDAVLEFCEAEL